MPRKKVDRTTVDRLELFQLISKATGYPQRDIRRMINAFIEIISQSLIEGRNVVLSNFGSFQLRPWKGRLRPAHTRMDPRRGLVHEREVRSRDTVWVKFKVTRPLAERVNMGFYERTGAQYIKPKQKRPNTVWYDKLRAYADEKRDARQVGLFP